MEIADSNEQVTYFEYSGHNLDNWTLKLKDKSFDSHL